VRRRPGRRPGLHAEIRAEPLDHRRFEDGCDDLEPAAADRAVLQGNVEDRLEQPGPADARRPAVRAT
jgi:hypothetical protein